MRVLPHFFFKYFLKNEKTFVNLENDTIFLINLYTAKFSMKNFQLLKLYSSIVEFSIYMAPPDIFDELQ